MQGRVAAITGAASECRPEVGATSVNTSSIAGLLPIPNLGAYAAAKSAVLGLSLSIHLEFEQVGSPLRVIHDPYRAVIAEHARGIGTDATPVAAPIW